MDTSDFLPNSAPKSLFAQDTELSASQAIFDPNTHQNVGIKSGLRTPELEQALDREFLRAFLLGKTSRTRETYQRIILEFFEFLKPSSFRDAQLASIQSFLELKKSQAHESRRLRLAVVKSFFTYGLKSGYISTNPTTFLPKMEAHHQISERYLTLEEVIRMIVLTTFLRDHMILKILYTAGIRLSELIALKWEDVQERETGGGQLLILGKGNKKRVVVLSSGVFLDLLKLKPLVAKQSDSVFTSREYGSPGLSKRSIQFIVDRARLRAGITKRVTPHWLRHAHASHALDKGAPIHLVTATLGHASVATTGKYLHARPQESSSRFLDF